MTEQSTAISVLTDTQVEKMHDAEQSIEAVLAACSVTRLRGLSVLRQSVELATGLSKLKAVLSDSVMQTYFMGLQGSKLGFVTDKDVSGGYPIAVVRDCLVEGMIRGLRPVGNEINIIAGQCYAAVNGVERLVLQFPGLTDFWATPGVPQNAGDKGALVPFHASWILNGEPMEMVRDVQKVGETMQDTRICVKVNSGMGPDAIIGKARRKLLFAVYQRIANSSFGLRDGDVMDAVGVAVEAPALTSPGQQEGKRVKLSPKPPREAPPVEAAPMREPGMEG